MSLNFNINREKISDEEINKNKDFDTLVKQFKEQSLKKARGDQSWWKNKTVQYATVIAGLTVICTITYSTLFKSDSSNNTSNDKKTTLSNPPAPTTKSPVVKPPSSTLRIPYASYKIDAAKGASLHHAGNSKINIPKKALVDRSGKEIVGEVTIQYREFHDLGDIVLSGIPMQYDSAGKSYQFESAGMFEIKGTQNGEPVFIKPGEKIRVEMASGNPETKFNQYLLDTVKGNWTYLKKDLPLQTELSTAEKAPEPLSGEVSTPKLIALTRTVKEIIPKQIDSVKSVYQTRIVKLPKWREPSKPQKANKDRPNFKIDGSYKDYPELAAFDNVLFEVGNENINYSKELHDITWSDIRISAGPQKGKNYLLTLIYRNRKENLVVYPVLSGADLEKAEQLYEERLQDYNQKTEQRKAEESRLLAEMAAKESAFLNEQKRKQKEIDEERVRLMNQRKLNESRELANGFGQMSNSTKVRRLFEISEFGIFNSDCPHAFPNVPGILPQFFDAQTNKPLQPGQTYLIDHSGKMVFALNQSNQFELTLKPGNLYSICVFMDKRIYVCDKQSMAEVLAQSSVQFPLKALPEKNDNLIGFKTFLEL